MTLNEVMKETADAIREKTGKSDLIAPVNFAEEIKGITSGGGDAPSGDDGWVYYKFDGEAVENTEGYDDAEFFSLIAGFFRVYYASSAFKIIDGVIEAITYSELNYEENSARQHLAFKTRTSENLFRSLGLPTTDVMPLKELLDYMNELMGGEMPPLMAAFANALTPCTKEEFEALITV